MFKFFVLLFLLVGCDILKESPSSLSHDGVTAKKMRIDVLDVDSKHARTFKSACVMNDESALCMGYNGLHLQEFNDSCVSSGGALAVSCPVPASVACEVELGDNAGFAGEKMVYYVYADFLAAEGCAIFKQIDATKSSEIPKEKKSKKSAVRERGGNKTAACRIDVMGVCTRMYGVSAKTKKRMDASCRNDSQGIVVDACPGEYTSCMTHTAGAAGYEMSLHPQSPFTCDYFLDT